MKILQVVTLVSDDGAFGGPLKVALNQAEELRGRGHSVTIAAAWRGTGRPPSHLQGTPARLFPARQLLPVGFSGLHGRGMLRWLASNVRAFDVVHVHAGRDLVSVQAMTVAGRAKVPYVTQTHGMVGIDDRLSARLLDRAATRTLLRRATCRLTLTTAEEAQLSHVVPGATVRRILNGVAPGDPCQRPSGPPEVLFCARLHARKRPRHFIAMADLLRPRVPEATFALVGPDEGEVLRVQQDITARGLSDVVTYEGALPYEAVPDRMRRAAVYVLPSVDEPFPMSLLEALSLGIPSVITDTCGIASVLAERRAALVTDGTPEQLADAVESLLLNPALAEAVSSAAVTAIAEVFSIQAVVNDLEEVYCAASKRL